MNLLAVSIYIGSNTGREMAISGHNICIKNKNNCFSLYIIHQGLSGCKYDQAFFFIIIAADCRIWPTLLGSMWPYHMNTYSLKYFTVSVILLTELSRNVYISISLIIARVQSLYNVHICIKISRSACPYL